MNFLNTVLTAIVTLIIAAIPAVIAWQKNRSDYKTILIKIRADHKAQLDKQPADNFNNILAATKAIRDEMLAERKEMQVERKELRLENKELEEELHLQKVLQSDMAAVLLNNTNKIANISLHNKALFKHLKIILGMKTIADVKDSRILVLEDDEHDTFLLQRLFAANRIDNVEYFADPDLFYAAINADARILIIDYKLSGAMTGIDIIKKVKEANDYRYFIMLSGMEDFEIVYQFNRMISQGVFLLKGRPGTNETLVKAVKDTMYYLKLLSDTYNEVTS